MPPDPPHQDGRYHARSRNDTGVSDSPPPFFVSKITGQRLITSGLGLRVGLVIPSSEPEAACSALRSEEPRFWINLSFCSEAPRVHWCIYSLCRSASVANLWREQSVREASLKRSKFAVSKAAAIVGYCELSRAGCLGGYHSELHCESDVNAPAVHPHR